MNDNLKYSAWESSYGRKENFVFVPNEEIVRFVARRLRRRVGLDEIVDVLPGAAGSRVGDFGCGIGRNLVFGSEMGFEMYGLDLSPTAVGVARRWLGMSVGEAAAAQRVVSGDVRSLPWEDGFFDHGWSDSALDSMSYGVAQAGVREIARVIKPGGLFYCNLIWSADVDAAGLNAREEIVSTTHEQGTIQCYFDAGRIHDLFEGGFEIQSYYLVIIEDQLTGGRQGRWNLVLERMSA